MENQREWQGTRPGAELLEGEPMARHTTFRIGGPARWFFRPASEAEAAEVLRACRAQGLVPFFLGRGSNLLVADAGWEGVVLSTERLDALRWEDGLIWAQSGVPLARLAVFAAQRGLTGLEFAQGIPGSVGGAVRMNAGAYGGSMDQVLEAVRFLDETGRPGTLSAGECALRYRHSVFCETPWLLTQAAFRLSPGDPEEIRRKMEDLARRRREKQPLEYPSAGSTFKRPPPQDGVERYAAALIDQCGLKGLRVGDAQVSEKHAGFLINRGGATCAQVLELMEEVRRRVLAQTGVELEPEVELLR